MNFTDYKDPKHPLWDILSFAVVCTVSLLFLKFNYQQFEIAKDMKTAVASGMAVYIGSFIKGQISN